MSAQEKPIICLVHGAWHRPAHYRLLINALRASGHTVLCPPNATSGYDDSLVGATLADDVARVHGVLLRHLDAGRQAILVAHSYGAVPGNMACEGQTVAEREKRGLKGGIVGVVYIASLAALTPGVSLYESWGNQWPSFMIHGEPENGRLRLKPLETSKAVFYSGVDEIRSTEATALLCDQATQPYYDPVPYVGQMIKVPKTFFVCLDDKAIPAELQRNAATNWGAKIVEFRAGHSPFLEDAGVEMLVKVISEAGAVA